jgi:low affinity Fe/Cu permease
MSMRETRRHNAGNLGGSHALNFIFVLHIRSMGAARVVQYFRAVLTKLGVLVSHPAAFVIVFCYVIAWIFLEPSSLDWHGIATVATWLMTLIIQRAEHRDTQAIHAKLDELLRADKNSRAELSLLDEQEPEVIEEHRSQVRRELR